MPAKLIGESFIVPMNFRYGLKYEKMVRSFFVEKRRKIRISEKLRKRKDVIFLSKLKLILHHIKVMRNCESVIWKISQYKPKSLTKNPRSSKNVGDWKKLRRFLKVVTETFAWCSFESTQEAQWLLELGDFAKTTEQQLWKNRNQLAIAIASFFAKVYNKVKKGPATVEMVFKSTNP